jgi:hypothetical protein
LLRQAAARKALLALHMVRKSELPEFMARATAFERRFLETSGFTAGPAPTGLTAWARWRFS